MHLLSPASGCCGLSQACFTDQVGRGFSFPANWFLAWSNIDVSLHPSLLAQDGALMGI